ncbi:MAG: superoxide dismutase [Bacilli bacterium]|nr:superoxide dismutase [Bacilli bacterium]
MYEMIKLKYNYKDLEPYYDSSMFNYHYNVLYKGYTDNLNKITNEFDVDRKTDNFTNIQSLSKRMSFNANAYILHSLFFENLIPMPNKTLLSTELVNHIKKDFGSYDSFIDELNASLLNIEGPGWVVFGYDKFLDKLLITQIEKHQEMPLVDFIPLLVIDVWEHSYYLQYKTDKKEYIRNLFYILDFNVVTDRYNKIYLP